MNTTLTTASTLYPEIQYAFSNVQEVLDFQIPELKDQAEVIVQELESIVEGSFLPEGSIVEFLERLTGVHLRWVQDFGFPEMYTFNRGAIVTDHLETADEEWDPETPEGLEAFRRDASMLVHLRRIRGGPGSCGCGSFNAAVGPILKNLVEETDLDVIGNVFELFLDLDSEADPSSAVAVASHLSSCRIFFRRFQ